MFTSPKIQSTKNFRNISNLSFRQRLLYGKPRRNNTGKEIDPETRLYYFGARYLDPKASRWLSGDPALGEYLPSAPVNDEARKRNGSLPGMGGVFNYVNLHVYHYAGNNPVRYEDPNGKADRDTHLGDESMGTYAWAIDRGFNPTQAERIANACNGVDSLSSGIGPFPGIGDQGYHFNTITGSKSGTWQDSRIMNTQIHLIIAISFKGNAIAFGLNTLIGEYFYNKALDELGKALHPIQDVFFHTDNVVHGVGIYWHSPFSGVDSIKRTKSVDGAADASKRVMDMFNNGAIDWQHDVWNPRDKYEGFNDL